MKKILFLSILFISLQCSMNENENVGVSFDKLESAPKVDVPFESLPEWLVDKINEIEIFWQNDKALLCLRIYKGIWQNRTIYHVYNWFDSCILCNVFYDDGKKVEFALNDELTSSYFQTSKNWVIIYEFGDECKYLAIRD